MTLWQCAAKVISTFLFFAVLVLRVNDCRPYAFFKLLSFFSIILAMADQYKVVYYLSIGAIFNDFERPLNPLFQGHANIRRICRICRKLSYEYLHSILGLVTNEKFPTT